MAVGNDVVDLADPETDLRLLHRRFAERVFTAAEQQALARCEPQTAVLHWALWAAKESAYKALKRRAPETVFSPREFAVQLPPEALVAEAGAASGAVVHRGRRFALDVRRDGDRIHAVARSADMEGLAILSAVDAAANDPSEDVRRLAARALGTALGLDPAAVRIAGRPPEATCQGRPLPAELSLSHHGRFVAFACALPR